MAAEGSGSGTRTGSAADSYIGSVISLTSKSEMRYEGVLYNINPDESSIGLRNVRSFGTEGRKEDGLQVPPSERVYEYILFRGSDIKDLQVKSSPAAQKFSPVNNDPAIIQSQQAHPAIPSRCIPPTIVSTTTGTSVQTSQLRMPGSNVQNNAPLYQPGASVEAWGSSQASTDGSGNGMPMYWQGYYAPPNGLPSHQYQQPLLRPPGLSAPYLLQQQMPSSLQQQMPPLQQQLPSSFQPQMPSSLQPHMPSSLQLQMPSSLQLQMPSSLQPQMPSSLQQQMPSLYQQMPSSFQQSLQFPNFSAPLLNGTSSLPAPPSLFPSGTGPGISASISSSSATFPSSFPPMLPTLPVTSLALDAVSSSLPIKAPIAPPLLADKTQVTSLSPASSLLHPGLGENGVLLPLSSRPLTTAIPSSHQNEIVPSSVEAANPAPKSGQAPVPALLTPGHLFKSSPISLAPSSKTVHKDAELVQESSSSVPETPASVDSNVKLTNHPLPTSSRPSYKPNGTHIQSYHGYRGRGRGRGRMSSLPLTTFNEEFDFTAMNEKFNKDEVWGHLGKSIKPHDQEDGKYVDEEFPQDEEVGLPKIDIKPVYNKDDFFDSLSSTGHDQEPNQGRHRFSEQRKIDTETFGEFSRYRGGRGSHGPGRGGGGRYRGSYYGRDFGRGGYGYGRIRGRRGPN